MFLTATQRAELTGARQKDGQIKWLTDNGFRFTVAASGWPVVLVAEVEGKMLSPEARKKRAAEPDFSVI